LNNSFDEEWDGPEKLKCKDLIYKFTINNNTQTPIRFRVKLAQKSADQQVNLHWPLTGVKGKLDIGETQVVAVLPKIRPDAPEMTNGVLEVDKLKIELFWKIDEEKMK